MLLRRASLWSREGLLLASACRQTRPCLHRRTSWSGRWSCAGFGQQASRTPPRQTERKHNGASIRGVAPPHRSSHKGERHTSYHWSCEGAPRTPRWRSLSSCAFRGLICAGSYSRSSVAPLQEFDRGCARGTCRASCSCLLAWLHRLPVAWPPWSRGLPMRRFGCGGCP